MLSKAKLKSALKKQDIESVKEILPTFKEFKIMKRNGEFHRLIVPAIKLLLSDKEYYKKLFDHNVMTSMFIFTHEVMKDFHYLKEIECEEINEALMRPLLNDEVLFIEAINSFFVFKFFQDTYLKYKNEFAKLIVESPDLFWRVITSFSNLQLFCEENPSYTRQAIMLVLCHPEKMKMLLPNSFNQAIFAGYCLIHSLVDHKIDKDVASLILTSAKECAQQLVVQVANLSFFSNKASEANQAAENKLTSTLTKR